MISLSGWITPEPEWTERKITVWFWLCPKCTHGNGTADEHLTEWLCAECGEPHPTPCPCYHGPATLRLPVPETP